MDAIVEIDRYIQDTTKAPLFHVLYAIRLSTVSGDYIGYGDSQVSPIDESVYLFRCEASILRFHRVHRHRAASY
jgi:hypothetical protein